MAPCQVHPIIIRTTTTTASGNRRSASAPHHAPSALLNPAELLQRPTGAVRRNLFGSPDQREMHRQFDNENARQRKRLESYKIIAPLFVESEPTKQDADVSTSVNNSVEKSLPLPDLIAKELEAHEKKLAERKQKGEKSASEDANTHAIASKDKIDDNDEGVGGALKLQRQKVLETTPTAMHTKKATKLRTVHISSNRSSEVTIHEAARYKPYAKQTLITDTMPKRKSVPLPP